MVQLIITILAGLGFCSMVHFFIHLIEKMNRNAIPNQKLKLTVVWSERLQDLVCFHYPKGRDGSSYLLCDLFSPVNTIKLEKLGYDLTTLKFEITSKEVDNINEIKKV